ncbi:MAG: DegV family protein [Clostridiales bacterium]|nr:DegV family protein [Clostridiales bacterium]
MDEYQIITDFGCDLPLHIAEEQNIEVIPMEVFIEGEEPKKGSEVDVYEFYQKLREKKVAKTSAVSIDAFVTAFTAHLEKGEDIVYVALSSGLSGTFSAANIAAGELREKFPERNIYIVDSRSGSIGEGLIAYFAALKKAEGATAEEVASYAQEAAYQLCSWFTVDDLFFLKRGGRLSAATAIVGSLFMIKPILHASEEGKLIPGSKARGRRGAIEALADAVERLAVNPAEQIIGISHSDCLKDALDLETMLREKWDIKDVIISEIGPVIGAHCGPGTLAIFFIGTEK